MPHSIEIKARHYLLKKIPDAKKSDNKTFDFIINGKYVEVKGKGAQFTKMDFISLTDKQHNAIGKIDFDIYLITGLNTNDSKMDIINPKKLKTIRVRKVTSYEYDKSELKKIIKPLS